MRLTPLRFEKGILKLLDQRKLPLREIWIDCPNSKKIHWAIRDMVVRGAPAIGIAAGYGLYLGMKTYRGTTAGFFRKLNDEARYLKAARPTGVNLRNIIDLLVKRLETSDKKTVEALKIQLLKDARFFHRQDIALCRAIGKFGQSVFRSGDHVLTHCNAGGLATTGYGTALGVLYASKEQGKKIKAIVDETRPLLQGARLTAWELKQMKIPFTLICDNSAASLMRQKKIQRIVVGADRIAANGDTANKIGTYNLAVLAKAHRIPFYIAAPSTTFDFAISSGSKIPIEERKPEEVTEGFGKRTAPVNVRVSNQAFDVTPHELITAFFTEAGVLKPPFKKSFVKIKQLAKDHEP